MSKEKMNKYKLFWAWQDEEEEKWLETMSENGWHLEAPAFPATYSFVRDEPQSYVYRLDYISATGDEYERYLQLFTDAGWEHIGIMGGWQYFRKKAEGDEQPEIFTDNASKIQKYYRVMAILVIFLPILLIFINTLSSSEREIYKIFSTVFAVIMAFYAYAMIRLLGRIGQLKKSL